MSRTTRFPSLRETDEQCVDVVLPSGFARTAAFADVEEFFRLAVCFCERQQRRIGERVVHDGVADHEQLSAAEGEQPGITGPAPTR